jgi:protein arginine kinase activator
MNKKCMKCGKPATHKFVRIEDNQIYDLFYCEEHALESSPYQKPKIPLSQILASLMSQEPAAQVAGPSEGDAEARCRSCGLAFGSYRKSLILGCPDCYESFYAQLIPELRKFHGNTKHTGRKPGGGKETSEGMGKIVPVETSEGSAGPIKLLGAPPETETADEKREIDQLKEKLNRAIAEEDFEKAAEYRDRIKELRASPEP